MYSRKKLKHTKTVPQKNCAILGLHHCGDITLGGNKTLPSRFRFATTALTVIEAHPQWSM